MLRNHEIMFQLNFMFCLNISRALRKDLPITHKTAITKEEQNRLDDEINVS